MGTRDKRVSVMKAAPLPEQLQQGIWELLTRILENKKNLSAFRYFSSYFLAQYWLFFDQKMSGNVGA